MKCLSTINDIRNKLGRDSKVRVDDERTRRMVAVIECMINQNSRDYGAANYPSLNNLLMQL